MLLKIFNFKKITYKRKERIGCLWTDFYSLNNVLHFRAFSNSPKAQGNTLVTDADKDFKFF